MGLYEVKFVYDIASHFGLSRFWYDTTDGGVDAETVAEAVAFTLTAGLLNMMNDAVTLERVIVKEVLQGTDKHVLTITDGEGTRTTDLASTFNAWGFHLFPSSGNFRVGSKRIPGVSEGNIDDGEPDGGTISRGEILSTQLSREILILIINAVLKPVLARLIDDGTAYLITQITGAQFLRHTTQSSRKRWTSNTIPSLIAPITNITWEPLTEMFTEIAPGTYGDQPVTMPLTEIVRERIPLPSAT